MIAAALLLAAAGLLLGLMARACREPDLTDDAVLDEWLYHLRDAL